MTRTDFLCDRPPSNRKTFANRFRREEEVGRCHGFSSRSAAGGRRWWFLAGLATAAMTLWIHAPVVGRSSAGAIDDTQESSSAAGDRKSQETDAPSADDAAQTAPAWLSWRNGDHLPGRLLGIEQGVLRWSSEAFSAPLAVRLEAIAAIHFNTSSTGASADGEIPACQLTLANGDSLVGTVRGITPEMIELETDTHGTVAVDRKHVVRLRRGRSSVVVLDELGPLAQWQPQSNRHPLTEWKEKPDGSFYATRRGAAIFRPVEFTSRSMTEIEIAWPKRAAFSLSFFGQDQKKPNLLKQLAAGFGIRPSRSTRTVQPTLPVHITVWDDELVVESSEDFAAIQPIDHARKRLRLRLFWDRPANKMWIVADGMEKPVEFALPDPIDPRWTLGFRIENLGTGTLVKEVGIVKWDGEVPTVGERTKGPSVETKDGKRRAAVVRRLDPQSRRLELSQGEPVRWDDVVHIDFGVAARSPGRVEHPHQVVFTDGRRVTGRIERATADAIWMTTSYSRQPIRCPVNNELRLVRLHGATADAPLPFILQAADWQIQAVPATAPSGSGLGIRPVGCVTPTTLAARRSGELRRTDGPSPGTLLKATWDGRTDLIYLDNQDVVPGTVVSWDKELVFRTADGTERSVDAAHVVAISFAGMQDESDGFARPGWESKMTIPRAVREEEGRIEFYGAASYRHPTILHSNEFKLTIRRSQQQSCEFEVRAFVEGDDWSSSGGGVIFGFFGNQVYARNLDGERGFSTQLDVRAAKRLTWTFRREKNDIVVSFRGNEFFRSSSRSLAGHGLALTVRRNGVAGRLQPRPILTLSGLETIPPADLFAAVLPRDKQVALRIPRRQRRNIPSHLFVARNGDLLRGDLVGIDQEFFRIAVRGTTRRVRRHRIAGVIRLTPPGENAAEETTEAADPDPAPYRISTKTMRLSCDIESVSDEHLVAASPLVGPLKIPVDQVQLVEVGSERRSVADAAFDTWQAQVVEALPKDQDENGNGAQ